MDMVRSGERFAIRSFHGFITSSPPWSPADLVSPRRSRCQRRATRLALSAAFAVLATFFSTALASALTCKNVESAMVDKLSAQCIAMCQQPHHHPVPPQAAPQASSSNAHQAKSESRARSTHLGRSLANSSLLLGYARRLARRLAASSSRLLSPRPSWQWTWCQRQHQQPWCSYASARVPCPGTEKTRGRECPVCERVPSRAMFELSRLVWWCWVCVFSNQTIVSELSTLWSSYAREAGRAGRRVRR